MSPIQLFTLLISCWILLSLPTLLLGFTKWDPVGRKGSAGIAPYMNSRVAWIVIESPALLVFPLIYLTSGNHHIIGNISLAIWIAHYAHRTIIWPLIVPREKSQVSVMLCASAFIFNCINGALWGWFMGYFADYPPDWMADPRFILGFGVVIAGAALNISSDYKLYRARSQARDTYVIPRGGMFELVSSPHLLGEIVEWVGFAIMVWASPGLAFALWTAANLIPRAIWRHRWYKEQFPEYPENRRALIPYLI